MKDMQSIIIFLSILLSVCFLNTFAEPISNIVIDGNFDDWMNVNGYTDPQDSLYSPVYQAGIPDCHDTDSKCDTNTPSHVYNPSADLIEYKLAHDETTIYGYFKGSGNLTLNAKQTDANTTAGRSYLQIGLDLDLNSNTGFCLCGGGYFPSSCGIDFNLEMEIYNGSVNTNYVILHAMWDQQSYNKSYHEQIQGIANPAGPATYHPYTEWVYWEKYEDITEDEKTRCALDPLNIGSGPFRLPNGAGICFVADKTNGPFFGSMKFAFSEDSTQLEISCPFVSLMNNSQGQPNLRLGQTINAYFTLETSKEYSIPYSWISDTSFPIYSYTLEPNAPKNKELLNLSKGELSGIIIGMFFAGGVLFLAIFLGYKKYTGGKYSEIVEMRS